ncbi:hypothetical protein BD413DRAFT_585677 [Trametes elegans]|nr:hypothetical protein BD413DRAFT_585677 [Trametes elegans]
MLTVFGQDSGYRCKRYGHGRIQIATPRPTHWADGLAAVKFEKGYMFSARLAALSYDCTSRRSLRFLLAYPHAACSDSAASAPCYCSFTTSSLFSRLITQFLLSARKRLRQDVAPPRQTPLAQLLHLSPSRNPRIIPWAGKRIQSSLTHAATCNINATPQLTRKKLKMPPYTSLSGRQPSAIQSILLIYNRPIARSQTVLLYFSKSRRLGECR